MIKYIITIILILNSLILIALDWDNAVPLRQGVNIEWFRTGASTDDGCAIYVWSDTKLGARDLYAQKVDAQGNMVWGDPLLVDGKIDRQEDPVITKASDGAFVIAWIDFSNDLDGNVYAQKVTTSGQLLWQTGGVPVCVYPGIQISLNIEPDNTGGAYIIWEDSRNPGKDLYGQRLNGSGVPQWVVNGIPIANEAGDESYNTMWADGTGGMIIGYVYALSGAESLKVKRFLPDGQMSWAQPLLLSPNPAIQNKIKMAPINADTFVFTWQDQREGTPDIYAQRVNLNGTTLWNDPLIVYADSDQPQNAPQENPRIVQTSDNCVIIIWEDKRNDLDDPDLYAQKIDINGQRLWDVNGIPLVVAPFFQQGPRMSSDGNVGCYVVWDDARNGNAPNVDIYLQHLSSSGSSLWQANGVAVCTAPNEQSGSLVKAANNNVFVNWMDMRNGSIGINYQVYNTSGIPQLDENGETVFWGLSGDATLKQIVVLPRVSLNDVALVWQDTRYANLGYQIFYQVLNADGSVDFEENGRSATTLTGNDQRYPSAVVLPDGKICVVWQENRVSSYKIFAQLIDTNGNRLWGDTGMEMTEGEPLSQKDPRISYFDGAIYIGWSNLDIVETQTGPRQFFHIYGQKIVGNTKLWGANGMLISEVNPEDMLFECQLEQIVDRYFVWTRTSVNPPTFGYLNVWAKLVDADGNSAPGWSDFGVVTSNYSDWDTNQYLPKAAVTTAGLFVGWLDFRTDFIKNIYGQLISTQGSVMWNPSGVPMADFGREQDELSILGGSDITFAWKESVTGSNQDVAIQRYSTGGTPVWGNMGYYVVARDTTQSSPNLAQFPYDGSMLVVWEDYTNEDANIYGKFIYPDGTLMGQPADLGIEICGEIMIQQYPQIAVINDRPGGSAIIAWSDGRSSGKEPIFGLYAQKLDNLVPAIDDNNDTPISVISINGNQPNPFTFETRINYIVQKDLEDLSVSVYNIKGQKVTDLYTGPVDKGNHELVWNGTDSNNKPVSAGLYFYKVSNGNVSKTGKMLLMK